MSLIQDVTEEIYVASDGKISYMPRGNSGEGSIREDIYDAVGRYTYSTAQTEDNVLYENKQRVRKIENVMSFVIADHATNLERSRYDNIMRSTDPSQFLNTTEQTKAQNLISNGFANSDGSIKIGTITRPEMNSLAQSGQFTRTINGKTEVFTVNGANKTTTVETLQKAKLEHDKNEKIINPKSTKEKIEAVGKMRGTSLGNLKAMGVNVGNGSTHSLHHEKASLLMEKEHALSKGDKATIASIDKKIGAIDSHLAQFGGTEKAQGNQSQRRRMGLRMIERSVEGADFSKGVDTVRHAAKTTKAAVRVTVRTAESVAYHVAGVAPGLKKTNAYTNWGDNRKQQIENAKRKKTKEGRKAVCKEKREIKRVKRVDKRTERLSNFEEKQNSLRANGKDSKAARRQRRHDRRDRERGIIVGVLGSIHGGFGRIGNGLKSVKDFLTNNRLAKIIKAPFNLVGVFKDLVKKYFRKFVAIPIGVVLLFVVIVLFLVDIAVYSIFFLSEAIRTDLTGALNNTNYVQVIVDDVSEQLSENFVNVAKVDAWNYFMDIEETDANGNSHAIPSDGIAWYKQPNVGELRNIYMAEDMHGIAVNPDWYVENDIPIPPAYILENLTESARTLDGINANLLPIISTMHYRFTDSINYEQWLTAKAYAYYMFVETHNICCYDYESVEDCAQEALYDGEDITWVVETKTLIRPINELCTNLYVHGYDASLGVDANRARAAGQDAVNTALHLLDLPYHFDSSAYGVFREELPFDSEGTCDHYRPVQAGNIEGTNPESDDVDNTCGKLEHIHGAECFSLTCEKDEHTHDGVSCNTNNCNHTHDASCCSMIEHTHGPECGGVLICSQCGGEVEENHYALTGCSRSAYAYMDYRNCDKTEHNHSDGDCNYTNCGHVHTQDCCDKEVHTHLPGPVNGFISCTDEDYNDCWGLTCEVPAHAHERWHIDDVTGQVIPGCWKTSYICLGHCGGHITPLIDINVDMTFESIAKKDFFKTVYWLGEDDFAVRWTDIKKVKSIKEWKEIWWEKMATWFLPYPSSPLSAIQSFGRGFVSVGAKCIDGITNGLADLLFGEMGEDAGEEDINNAIYADTHKDMYGFDGWYDENGELQQGYIEDLESIYGNFEEKYRTGEIEWRDSFDVTFPLGGSLPLRSNQIDSIMSQLDPNLSEERKAVIQTAAEYVGKFWYDLSTRTQNADAVSGRIDAAGFVSSVLRHALDWQNDWTECDFANAGYDFNHNPGSLMSGDILAMSRTSTWNPATGWSEDGNHVIIYLGYFEDGIFEYDSCTDAGHYVISCDFQHGGASLIKAEDGVFNQLNYVYRGCYY